MSIALASHNEDIRRLIDRGYAVGIDGGHLVVRDIPYLNHDLECQTGAFVAKLVHVDAVRVTQDDHQVYFAGSVPYGLDARPIPNLAGGPKSIPLNCDDVIVQRSFSNKPPNGFPDFFAKIEHYTNVIAGPAMEKFDANPLTFRIAPDAVPSKIFKLCDTLSSRAEISDLAQRLHNEAVAVIGLGGTGSYLLDLLCKSPVGSIRAFDNDVFHVHNAYRSPGALAAKDLGCGKAQVYDQRYANFRHGLEIHDRRVDLASAPDLEGITFAFVCVDKGSARAEIFDLLIGLGIPFIDVGLGVSRLNGALAGMIRTTYYPPATAAKIRAMKLAEEADVPGDEYRANVQIAELNALNAAHAIILFKQIKGFYYSEREIYNSIFQFDDSRMHTNGLNDADDIAESL